MSYSITKLENGKYKVRVWGNKDVFGKRPTAQKSNISGITSAEKWAKITFEKLNETESTQISKDITFKELIERYEKERKSKVSITTINTTFDSTKKIVLEYFKNIKAKDITTLLVQEFADLKQSTGLKSKTVKNRKTNKK